MKVIGLNDTLIQEAEQQCAEEFRAWMAETRNGTWGNWTELLRHYPRACRTGEDEAHFPLTDDGTGVRAMVFFPTQLILLDRIAPAPAAERMTADHRFTLPPTTQTTRANANQPI